MQGSLNAMNMDLLQAPVEQQQAAADHAAAASAELSQPPPPPPPPPSTPPQMKLERKVSEMGSKLKSFKPFAKKKAAAGAPPPAGPEPQMDDVDAPNFG